MTDSSRVQLSSLPVSVRRMPALRLAAALAIAGAAFLVPVPGDAADLVETPGVLAVIDREDIALSGAHSVSDFLHHRLGARYFNTFGVSRLDVLGGAAILIDGRRAWGADVGVRPISAIERIEILGENASALHGEGATGGTINIVLRRGYEGTEVSAAASRPTERGGDAERVSAFWGGVLGRGHATIGVEAGRQQELRDRDREFSRATWTPGGSFADAQGVSAGGNTAWFVDLTSTPKLRYAALGDCPTSVYTGTLSVPGGGVVCGFPYAETSWNNFVGRSEDGSLFLTADHPFGDDVDLYIDARAAFGETRDRYAPPVGEFDLVEADSPFKGRLQLASLGLMESEVPDNARLFHRFVGHGNRDWTTDTEQYDVTAGLRGSFGDGIGHDAWLRFYRFESVQKGGTFVSEPLIEQAIAAGRYDFTNPSDPDLTTYPDHWDAVRDTSVRLTRDIVSEHTTAHVALDGPAFALPGGALRWTVGTELSRQDHRHVYDHRTLDGAKVATADALGSGGTSAEGDRKRWSAFAEFDIPLLDAWDLALAARHDDYDDVDSVFSQRIASRYRLADSLALRASWVAGGNPPGLHTMHERDSLRHPYVCDKLVQGANCVAQQREWANAGNPDLKPSETESVSMGATVVLGPLSLHGDWFQLAVNDKPALPSPQSVLDLEAEGAPLPPGARVVRTGAGGSIDYIETRTLNLGEEDINGMNLGASVGWETDWLDLALDVHWLRVTRYEERVAGELQPGDVPGNRVHAALRATRSDVTALWSMHAMSAYDNDSGDGRYDSWVGHDLAVLWRNVLGIDGLNLTGGVMNAGDRGPPADSADRDQQDESLDALLGRTFFVRTTMAW